MFLIEPEGCRVQERLAITGGGDVSHLRPVQERPDPGIVTFVFRQPLECCGRLMCIGAWHVISGTFYRAGAEGERSTPRRSPRPASEKQARLETGPAAKKRFLLQTSARRSERPPQPGSRRRCSFCTLKVMYWSSSGKHSPARDSAGPWNPWAGSSPAWIHARRPAVGPAAWPWIPQAGSIRGTTR